MFVISYDLHCQPPRKGLTDGFPIDCISMYLRDKPHLTTALISYFGQAKIHCSLVNSCQIPIADDFSAPYLSHEIKKTSRKFGEIPHLSHEQFLLLAMSKMI